MLSSGYCHSRFGLGSYTVFVGIDCVMLARFDCGFGVALARHDLVSAIWMYPSPPR